jgi:CRP-like cAMP-binding protein
MEEVFYRQGDKIIVQDDIGDSFYVVEDGIVSILVIIDDFTTSPRSSSLI